MEGKNTAKWKQTKTQTPPHPSNRRIGQETNRNRVRGKGLGEGSDLGPHGRRPPTEPPKLPIRPPPFSSLAAAVMQSCAKEAWSVEPSPRLRFYRDQQFPNPSPLTWPTGEGSLATWFQGLINRSEPFDESSTHRTVSDIRCFLRGIAGVHALSMGNIFGSEK